jgi:peroxiredoxin
MKNVLRMLAVWTVAVLAAAAAQVPRPAPDYAVKLPDGKQLKLSQFRGKVVVLEFLLTYCGGCQHAGQVMEKLQQEIGTSKLQVLGVAFDDANAQKIAEFRAKSGARFPIGIDKIGDVYGFLQHSSMIMLLSPSIVIIDKKGVIRAQHTGDDRVFFSDEERNAGAVIMKLLAEK